MFYLERLSMVSVSLFVTYLVIVRSPGDKLSVFVSLI